MTDTGNRMSDAEIEAVVKETVKTAPDPLSARETLEKMFPSSGPIWVKSAGNFQWQVQIQPYLGGELYDFKCDRPR